MDMIMTNIHNIHLWDHHICFFIGILLNSTLIWFIIKKSPKEMRFYSRILLQTAIADTLLVAITELLNFTFFMYQNRVMFYLDGPLAKLLPHTMAQFILVSLWFQIFHISFFGQAVQFFYRYLVLNRDIKISLARYWSLLLIIVLCTSIWLVFVAIAGYPIDDAKRFVDDRQLAQLISGFSDQHPPMLAVNMDSTQATFKMVNYSYTVLNIISYAVIIFCGVKMIKFVRKNTIKSPKHELDRQLTRSLTALAAVPLLLMFCNIAIASSCPLIDKLLLLSTDNKQLDLLVVSVQILSAIPLMWITVFNPLIVMITIKPYRRTIFHFLIRARAHVAPLNTQNNVIGQNSANARVAWS